MKAILVSLFFFFLITEFPNFHTHLHLISGQETMGKSGNRLSKPLIGDDGRVYACSERSLYAFESNGSIAWSVPLNYTCNLGMAPVHGGPGKIYLVAENRVLKASLSNPGTSMPSAEIFFGPKRGQKDANEIVGLSFSGRSSSVFINIKQRGLFAYLTHGPLLWSAGPVIDQYGYRQGCRKTVKDCYFSSVPVIDRCEANIYISNNQGELYCLSVRGPHFKWIQDLSSFDTVFTVTPGNNGLLYVTVPERSLVLVLDVFSGSILWQGSIGPLSKAEYMPVVDSNGWLSIGSLDGSLYSFSPTGALTKYLTTAESDSVVQVSPYLDCSGYAIYVSQTKVENKTSYISGEYSHVSAARPKSVAFTLLVPATGSIYWSESYPGQLTSILSESDMHQFVLDEAMLLALVTASKTGNPLKCRTSYEKLMSSCSQARAKLLGIYSGEERAMALFLLFESVFLIILAVLVRFCCIFWSKRKLQGKGLGNFLLKRRELQIRKKSFDRTISELEQKAANEAINNKVLEKLDNLLREREVVRRKLTTTYSLGRDGTGSLLKPHLPSYDAKLRSYSFQGTKKESLTIFHTLSDTSSEDSFDGTESSLHSHDDDELATKAKGKAPVEDSSSSDDETYWYDFQESPSEPSSSLNVVIDPLSLEQEPMQIQLSETQSAGRTLSLKRRKTLSSTD